MQPPDSVGALGSPSRGARLLLSDGLRTYGALFWPIFLFKFITLLLTACVLSFGLEHAARREFQIAALVLVLTGAWTTQGAIAALVVRHEGGQPAGFGDLWRAYWKHLLPVFVIQGAGVLIAGFSIVPISLLGLLALLILMFLGAALWTPAGPDVFEMLVMLLGVVAVFITLLAIRFLFTRFVLTFPLMVIEHLPFTPALTRSALLLEGQARLITRQFLLIGGVMLALLGAFYGLSTLLPGDPGVKSGAAVVLVAIPLLFFSPLISVMLGLIYLDRRTAYDRAAGVIPPLPVGVVAFADAPWEDAVEDLEGGPEPG